MLGNETLNVIGSINTKRGRRLALKTLELSSFGGGWTDRNGSGPGVARDKKPVGGVEETVVGCHVGVVRLADRIGFVCDVPSAGSTPEGDGGRCQGFHRGKEVTPIGLPVVELYRAGARSEREVNMSFRCENSGSDDAGRRELRARYVDGRGQGYVVGGIRNSKREFLTDCSIADRWVVAASAGEFSVDNIPIASTTPVHPRRKDVGHGNEFLTDRLEH